MVHSLGLFMGHQLIRAARQKENRLIDVMALFQRLVKQQLLQAVPGYVFAGVRICYPFQYLIGLVLCREMKVLIRGTFLEGLTLAIRN